MDSRFKIILSNNNLYKEIELSPEMQQAKVGTSVDCDFRLHKNLFFGQIELVFTKNNGAWTILCSDNLYITVGDVRKLATKPLVHGDILEVRYQESDNTVLNLEFLLDFDNGKRKYERVIDVSACNNFSIGTSANCNISLKSYYVKNDYIELTKQNNGLLARIQNTTYGLYHNGQKTEGTAKIANGDFFSVSDYFFYYKNGKLWTEIRPDMIIGGLNFTDNPTMNNYPRFNRNTRIRTALGDDKIEILDPPAKPQKPKGNVFSRLLPSIIMVVAGLAMSMVSPFMLLSSGIGVVTAIIGLIQGNSDFKKDAAERINKYNAYIENKKREIEQHRYEEQSTLEEIYISPETEQYNFSTFSPNLFDRNKEDEDFLCVRLGLGDVEAKREIDYKKQEKLEVEDDLQQIPESLYNYYKNLHNAPIVCDFKKANAVGIVGEASSRFEFLKNLVIDISARHYYTDVKMLFVSEEKNKGSIRWTRLLPHVFNDTLGIRNIVCDDESKNIIFEYLYKELTNREQNKSHDNHIVAFFYDECGFKSHPISKFVDKAKDLGITFVFFGNTRADIPMGCDSVIEIKDAQTAVLINTHDKNESSAFVYPRIATAQAENIVNLLAPVYTEEISLEGTLTKNISLFELLNIIAVDDIDLASRWQKSQVFKSMAAPLGVSKTGVVSLDLHDKAHGPHGLVAGTTGSGKSEILQTYILAMATLFHPYEVGFVIIDFKGGGMVNQFKNLPHLVGAITNIDGKEINRSLKSIKAELQKRQRLFAEAEVNHIDKYIKKYKANEVSTPLPHLIIIVDEFAELKAEQPEFMKELISAARIGRSLGVHLILATQKPSGQVNEQIWSNSKFKLCLKVQSQEDSNEVIKSPLAAEIKEPGRAYLQVGNNEIFELFQSAYSGASEKTDDSNVKEFTIYGLNDSGRRIPVYAQKKQKSGEGSATQLDAIVRYVDQYCSSIGLKKLPDICLPSLGSVINFPSKDELQPHSNNIVVELGVFDDPDNQYQGQYSVDLTNENMMIIGSSQSGKTNLLQNIIRSISTKYTPNEVNIYIIDFASMVLKTFEGLNHVGGVVTSSEDEKLKNLFKLLYTEIETRKEKLLSVGVSSFSAYKEAGKTDLPQIVLMIDNLTALKELYFQDDDELLNLCREGLSVGISVIIANSQTSGIGYKYLSNFSNRIAMFCNDSSEYSTLFDHCSERLDDIHGRCIIDIDKTHLECQTYLAFEGEKEIDRVNAIREYIKECNAKNAKMVASIIPVIPELLNSAFVKSTFANFMQEPGTVAFGLDYASVSPFVIDFNTLGMLAVSGREGSGKHNFLKYAVNMLEAVHPGTSEVYIVDGISRKLSTLQECKNVKAYELMPEKAIEIIKQVEEKVKARYEALANDPTTDISRENTIVVLLNNYDAVEAISNDMDAMNSFKNITGKYKNMRVCVLLGAFENVNVPYSAPEIMKKARDSKHFMFFDDMANMKIIDIPLSVIRGYKKPIELGDGYYIKDNEYRKIKTALN
ncbi:MAG: type VII secretion protein EssC [Clostridia bacterium]|nr:type VII secretion protein EssC [Clostridia bacterium]